ncbi:TetR/AcrR family transcriptional regulator [Mycobacterium sp. 94-17]|uniref:TetR/AcrR family transcriptional regulator n=1 Tax=Mycobacterium sp. 94-17 TaxID=2986147 RepID=UPI002D1ED19C|nr:TetR/AcrR family transcriptional regulator [Mycobacterium sp. 94-17]MEB4209561.1 TetR/AcrR family transcriptional regulator [Mycobacterium sp. 94-17]
MRTRGWGGATPASDEEAKGRILSAAKTAIDIRGADIGIAEIARAVGVTRQTVYRYFPSTEDLLFAAAMDSASGFLDRLAKHLLGIGDPADAVVEAMATTLEWLPEDRYVRLLLTADRTGSFTASVTSDKSIALAHSMMNRFDVDWEQHGFSQNDLDELGEHMLRILQSFVVDPGRPPRKGKKLRGYLRRQVGAAVEHRGCR